MRIHWFIIGAALLFIALAIGLSVPSSNAQQADPSNPMNEIDALIDQGLPKSAIEKLQPIIDRSLETKDYPTAIRAICTQAFLGASIEGERAEEKIKRLEAAIAIAPEEMKPTMQTILAAWYWQFFQQNQWQFMQRTTADQSSNSEDILTWSLPQILRKIDEEFDKAFANSDTLKKISTDKYRTLLEQASSEELFREGLAYRPTLYDVIAHYALQYYASETQAGVQMVDAFQITADSPAFAPRAEFLAWKPETADQQSLNLRAVELYQDLLRFHENDDDKTALLDTDLLRLAFVAAKQTGNAELQTERLRTTYEQFAATYEASPQSTRAIAELANIAHAKNEFKQAHEIASKGMARFPDSQGAVRCYNLIQQIEAKSYDVTCDRVWNDPQQKLEVHYRNLAKLYFRLVPYDHVAFLNSDRYSPEQMNEDELRLVMSRTPTKAWSVDLAPTPDYLQKKIDVDVPAGITRGSYFLLTSFDGDFNLLENDQIGIHEVWISNLGLMVRNDNGENFNEGIVVDAQSGKPLANVTVEEHTRSNNPNQPKQIKTSTTDANGIFRFPAHNGRRYQNSFILAKFQDDRLLSDSAYYRQKYSQPTIPVQTVFFTDRTIYRPGQTIYYKAISFKVDPAKDLYQANANRRNVVVVLRDANGQEVEKRTHQTNEYGSLSGTFTAPRDRLTGAMSISIENSSEGSTSIRVEEYKRPKFEVTVDAPKDQVKLGDQVTVKGTAKAYTGVPIDNAKVVYRVMREVRFPVWYYWRYWWAQPRESTAIANGVVTTSSDGTFEITFSAQPDSTVEKATEPKFNYTIYADVTDGTGETRSGEQTIALGYTSLAATLSSDGWLTPQQPTTIKITTTSLDGKGQQAAGTIKIYTLKQPEKVIRQSGMQYQPYRPFTRPAAPPDDEVNNNTNSWPLDRLVAEADFQTNAEGNGEMKTTLQAGIYRAVLETQDRSGNKISAVLPLTIIDPQAKQYPIKVAKELKIEKSTLEPGDALNAVLGSGYEKARFFVVIKHRDQVLKSYWTEAGQTQHRIELPITEAMRGGFLLSTTLVHENRIYHEAQYIDVPWTNKDLSIQWERFVSKLEPGQKETWTAIVRGPNADKVTAEMVATLYDASLDAIVPFDWMKKFGFFRRDQSSFSLSFESRTEQVNMFRSYSPNSRYAEVYIPQLSQQIIGRFYWAFNAMPMQRGMMRGGYGGAGGGYGGGMAFDSRMEAAAAPASELYMMDGLSAAAPSAPARFIKSGKVGSAEKGPGEPGNNGVNVDLSGVAPRKNLNETAFFFPNLISQADGSVKLEFTMPEALTKWKFLAFAHDANARSGSLSDTIVTSKDIMVQPNAPRFLREGDEIEFTAKVSNTSPTQQSGTVRLSLIDSRTNNSIDAQFNNEQNSLAFEVPAGETRSVAWRIKVPDGIDFITYRVVGSTGRLSDGEEGYLPIISRRILVTESISLPIRGQQTKDFNFTKLSQSGNSETLKHQSLTVQMVSNPSWYAILALPYLMEFPHECSEQVFSRLYANSLGQHIVTSSPEVKRVFDQWRGTKTLDSPLTKNEDLKAVLLEESPWVNQALDESQSRRDVALLFDANRMQNEIQSALSKLEQNRNGDGLWPWFPGGPSNEFISLYIVTGFGRLQHLGVNVQSNLAIEALYALDAKFTERYNRISQDKRELNHLDSYIALYLYGRSFFIADHQVAPEHKEAFDYWTAQAKKYWLPLNNRQSQAQLAIALKRLQDSATPKAIMASIKERSISSEEMGTYWRDAENPWYWYHAPIESHSMMIEAFDEVMNDQQMVEDCKVWLIKQKQTQNWRTTKATADAVYAIVLRGADLLGSKGL